MRDIKVDWSLSPKGATELVTVALIGQKWRNSKTKQYWDMNGDFAGYYGEGSPIDEAKVIAIRPQIAAVADAVASFKATRENLEKIAKDAQGEFVEVDEKESEPECTHEIRATKEYCYISEGPNDSGQVFIKTNKGIWDCLYVEQLKPIKPTITKSDFADFVIEKLNDGTHQDAVCYLLQQKLDQHEVIEGPAND